MAEGSPDVSNCSAELVWSCVDGCFGAGVGVDDCCFVSSFVEYSSDVSGFSGAAVCTADVGTSVLEAYCGVGGDPSAVGSFRAVV